MDILNNRVVFIFSLFLLLVMYSRDLFAENKCSINGIVNLNIFKKNDYKFYNYICESSEGLYLKGYLGDKDKKIFVDNYSDFAAKESPKLLAVSIYKPNKRKPPILITINSAYYCCTPQIEGKIYQVKVYQISENKILNLKNITNILGSNAEGFEGIAEGKVYYKYKTISEIKKWLDKNY
ncbi:hypothetical protein [Acinetobacter seifertii]|uniref:hypothetical protein n=1 Tax=Acinetobacter seifertii TaxID=1530123 RepID=UPI00168AB236|nr:hypothetical protein [Acinetobacter seifertii]QNX87706.1 hypothetical protein IC772_00615 [Acinetobacter seifertii]